MLFLDDRNHSDNHLRQSFTTIASQHHRVHHNASIDHIVNDMRHYHFICCLMTFQFTDYLLEWHVQPCCVHEALGNIYEFLQLHSIFSEDYIYGNKRVLILIMYSHCLCLKYLKCMYNVLT